MQELMGILERGVRSRNTNHTVAAVACWVSGAALILLGIVAPAHTRGDKIAKGIMMLLAVGLGPIGAATLGWARWKGNQLLALVREKKEIARVLPHGVRLRRTNVITWWVHVYDRAGRRHDLYLHDAGTLTQALRLMKAELPDAQVVTELPKG